MSVDPDRIDLNSQVAGSHGPEKEPSASEPAVAETLSSSVPGQAQPQAQVVDRVDATVKNRVMEIIDEVSGAGRDTGSVEEGCDKAKISSLARCSSMEGVDGRSVNGKENGVSEIGKERKPEKSETLPEVVDGICAKKSLEVSSPKKSEILAEVVDGITAEKSSEVCSPKKTDSLVEVVDGISAKKSTEVSSPIKSETLAVVVDGISAKESPEVSSPKRSETLAKVVDGISLKRSPEVSSLSKDVDVSAAKDVDVSAAKDVDVSAGVDVDVSFNQLVQGMEIDSPAEKSRVQINSSQSSGEVRSLSESRSTSVDHDMSMDGDSSSDVEASSDDSKPRFTISDLVWAKVMSYPWWPGQIFDPSHASEKAKKMTKKGAYLVAYFGDDTFAWSNESKIKPFGPHFPRMERQSNSAEFLNAVNCALDEISRRTELSLSCSCSSRFRSEEVATEGTGDFSFPNASLFKPSELVEFLRGLAPSPLYETVDKLQLMTSQAQLLAFNRWKGFQELPRFEILLGKLESAADIPPSEGVKESKQVNGGSVPRVDSGEKCLSGGNISSGQKEKSLAELLAETKLKLKNGKKGPSSKPEIKHKSASLGRKRKDSDPADNGSTQKRKKKSSSSETANDPPPSKQTFRVGACILKVASQMTYGSSQLKNGDGNTTKSAVKNKKQLKKEK